jgi:NitT/TauT family transport system permease protein
VIGGSPLFPPFTDVFLNMVSSAVIGRHLLYSLMRMTAGLGLAAGVGICLGIIAGMSKRAGKFVLIPSFLLHPVPKTLFIPLIVLGTGIGETSKIILVFMALVFQIILSIRDSVRSIPKGYFTSIQAAGGGQRSSLRYIVLPAVMPGLFSTIRISLGIAAAVLFFSEYFGTEYGMGFFIMDARTRINFTDLYSGILALSLMMLIIFRILALTEKIVCRWRHDELFNPLNKQKSAKA